MSRLLIRNGRVLDPSQELDAAVGEREILIEDGRIAALGADLSADGATILNAGGAWIAPGLIDLHTHLREPGEEYKEDLASGGRAAVTQCPLPVTIDGVSFDSAPTWQMVGQRELPQAIEIRSVTSIPSTAEEGSSWSFVCSERSYGNYCRLVMKS